MYIWIGMATGTTIYRAIRAAAAAVSLGDEMTFSEIMKNVVDIGITPVLLIIFIIYFICKSRNDDNRVIKANEQLLQREQQLADEAAKREKLIRQESEKQLQLIMEERARREQQLIEDGQRREEMIRRESEKRESILMGNMERMIQNMDQITLTMRGIDQSMAKINERLEKIEERTGAGNGSRHYESQCG